MPKKDVNPILNEDVSVPEGYERAFEHFLHDENNWDHFIVIHHLVKWYAVQIACDVFRNERLSKLEIVMEGVARESGLDDGC